MRVNFDMKKEDLKGFDELVNKLDISRSQVLRSIIRNIDEKELKEILKKDFI